MEDTIRRGECEEVDDEMISAWLISTAEINSLLWRWQVYWFFLSEISFWLFRLHRSEADDVLDSGLDCTDLHVQSSDYQNSICANPQLKFNTLF
jgi:hypothetical protein